MADIGWIGGAILNWSGFAIALAACVQSVTGFGFPLVAVALLPLFIDLSLAVPLVVVMSLLNSGLMLVRYRKSLDWQGVRSLILAAVVMIPVGLLGLHYVPEAIARKALGSFVLLYVFFDGVRLLRPRMASLSVKSSGWAYVFGGLSGFLTGAFTTGGPPLVMYATAKGWQPAAFKSNLSAVYTVSLAFALAIHSWSGNLTHQVWQTAMYSLPLFGVGMGTGFALSRWISAAQFKRLVLVLLAMIGLRLLF